MVCGDRDQHLLLAVPLISSVRALPELGDYCSPKLSQRGQTQRTLSRTGSAWLAAP